MNTEDLSSNEDDVEISEDSIQDTTSEEDMFLPQCIPSQIESLPRLLRLSTKSRWYDRHLEQTQAFPQIHLQHRERIKQWMRYLEPNGIKVSQELLLLNDRLSKSVVIDFLPLLKRIGLSERAAEAIALQSREEVPSHRRVTRRQAKASRGHYFDKISERLKLDMEEITSSELGGVLADSILVYDRK